MLDLSAAFDTIVNETLLRRLERHFGITGKPLAWITSYMTDRYQTVCINNKLSQSVHMEYSVPKVSALGPKSYVVYTKPVGEICPMIVKVYNFLATLDLKLISLENLKEMERRAGEVIEAVSTESQRRSAEEAYKKRNGVFFPFTSKHCVESYLYDVTILGIGHTSDPDIQTLPDAVPKGTFKPVKTENPTFITFDLETTDLIRGSQMPHITQIAAKEIKTAATFNQYVTPAMPIAAEAQQITGIKVTDDGYMTVRGAHVNNLNVHESLDNFCKWLAKFQNPVLIAHNG
ncbi:uncharacterized protein LOC132726254 [Ruditapes philippinarum]|uniref:uncharacterized protein LOC132726254 n=1 Tax=Ruditapes philippinarum TaxID=129788 RepID=UPI00295B3B7D|nr:uncharacterized protein LOC132726254 [Ruditapes philippinarum]